MVRVSDAALYVGSSVLTENIKTAIDFGEGQEEWHGRCGRSSCSWQNESAAAGTLMAVLRCETMTTFGREERKGQGSLMTTGQHKRNGAERSCTWAVLPAVSLLVLAGCGFDATGTGNPPQPGLGCYDLDPTEIWVVDEPDAYFQVDGVLNENEPFSLRWNVCYKLGTNQDMLTSDPYSTRVRIFSAQDGQLVESFLDEDVMSDSIETGQCRDEEFYIANGLPAGQYRAYAILDSDDVVYECAGLAYSYSNTVEVDFMVAAFPADDLTVRPSFKGDTSGFPKP